MPTTTRPAMEQRRFRCADLQWAPVEREAAADGISESEVVRRALRHYFHGGVPAAPDTSKVEK